MLSSKTKSKFNNYNDKISETYIYIIFNEFKQYKKML